MPTVVDPKILEVAEKVIADNGNSRASKVLKVMLDKGSISTDEIQALGYNHPPRAIGDVRDAGVPVTTGSGTTPDGRRMAVYTFGDPSQIQEGRIGGRSALPKAFKAKLIATYGSIDCITGAKLDDRVLQIDHRIPYRIAGDIGLRDHSVPDYMLLDASSQRAKSYSCEQCKNMTIRDIEVCKTCFWAFPETYTHIAMQQIRRTDIAWQGNDVVVHDTLKAKAEARGLTLADFILDAARQIAKDT